ncbi:MAG: caspase family protein, partial [Clostridiales bacterium]|nr:caspase family protein [Clostridiales bacterium]
MSKTKWLYILLLFLGCICSINGDYYFLLIGIEDYKNNASGLQDLNFCKDDAYGIRDQLINCGAAEDKILTLTDSYASKKRIHSAITQDLKTVVQDGDTVIIFFAGHGGQTNKDVDPKDEDDGKDEYIIPWDGDPFDYDTLIIDDELKGWISELNPSNICLIFDSCHSGGMERNNQTIIRTNNQTQFDLEYSNDFSYDLKSVCKIILSAARANESSGEYTELKHGVFSYYIIQALQDHGDTNSDGEIQVEELFDYVRDEVIVYTNGNQHPEIYDNYPGDMLISPVPSSTTSSGFFRGLKTRIVASDTQWRGFVNLPKYGDGTYLAQKWEIRSEVGFPDIYSPESEVFPNLSNTVGYSGSSTVDCSNWTEVIPNSYHEICSGITGVTLKTYCYWLERNIEGSYIGEWVPCPPYNAKLGYSIKGNTVAPGYNPFPYEYGGDNSVEYRHTGVAYTKEYTKYIYPKDSSYKIYDWTRIKTGNSSRAYDTGTYIDYDNNRLVVKYKLNGKSFLFPAYYYYKYFIFCRRERAVSPPETIAPVTAVSDLNPVLSSVQNSFDVSWSGTDDTKIKDYQIECKINTGDWKKISYPSCGNEWIEGNSILFPWTRYANNGDRIYFRSIGRDVYCNEESPPASPDYDTYIDIDLLPDVVNILTSSNSTGEIRLFSRDGYPRSYSLNPFNGIRENISWGDIDGDGIDEIITGKITTEGNDSNIKIYKIGSLNPILEFETFSGSNYGVKIACGDVDNDGKDEIIAVQGFSISNDNEIKIYKIDYDGT